MNYKIEKYPFNKDCAFAITIDDLHPEGKDKKNKLDFGYNFREKFWTRIKNLKSSINEIKFTIFTVANWIDLNDYPSGIFFPIRKIYKKRRSYPHDTFNIDDEKFRDWIEELNKLGTEKSIEFAMHGLYHHNPSLNGAHSQEFLNLDKTQFNKTLGEMISIFKKSGLNFSRGFRPPGWGLNSEKINILGENKISYIAASSDFKTPIKKETTNAAGLKNVNIFRPTQIDKLLNFNANCYPHQFERAVEIADNEGIIIVHCHIAPTVIGLKYVDYEFERNIKNMLREIKFQTGKTIWFATLSEIANYTNGLSQIRHSITNNRIRIENLGSSEINGLTITINNRKYVINKISPRQVIEIDPSNYRIENTKVSAILTVYNGAKNVIPSLQSLCDQSYRNLEIIVVNDGSTDNTVEVLTEYAKTSGDSKIRIISQQNGGRSKARNTGFHMSNGDIITFCEDDALYSKDYIKDCVSHFKKSKPKLGGVIGPHYVWNREESLNTISKDLERRRNFQNYKPTSSWFYTREVFEKVGYFNEDLELVEDVEPAIKLSRMGYTFEYEPDSIWLHKEPASIKKYLRRKYRGGIGLALLEKENLKAVNIPTKFIVFAPIALLALIGLVLSSKFLFILFLSFIPAALLVLRFKDLVKSIGLSSEPIHIIVFALYIEYLWWAATFLGYLKGLSMTKDEINTLLKGR